MCALIDKSIAVAEVALSGDYSELELVVFDVLNVLPTVRMFVDYRPPNYDQNASNYVNVPVSYTHLTLPTIYSV